MDWGKLLGEALKWGVVLKSVADIDNWINEKMRELSNDRTFNSALVEISYEVAKMDNDDWKFLSTHIGLKTYNNKTAQFLFDYCNYVVKLESNEIKDLLSYEIREAWDILSINVRSMETYEIAAYYGILKAYSEKNMKARAISQAFERLLN